MADKVNSGELSSDTSMLVQSGSGKIIPIVSLTKGDKKKPQDSYIPECVAGNDK
jgi:hypothetical protein